MFVKLLVSACEFGKYITHEPLQFNFHRGATVTTRNITEGL